MHVYLLRLTDIQGELNEPLDPSDPQSMTLAQVNELVRETRRETPERKTA